MTPKAHEVPAEAKMTATKKKNIGYGIVCGPVAPTESSHNSQAGSR